MVTRARVHRLPRGRARRAVRGLRRRARRRPRLRRRSGRGRGRRGARQPARRGARRPGRRPARRAAARWPDGCSASSRPHGRRPDRLAGQDHDQGPAGGRAGRRRSDGGHAGVLQQRAGAAADGAARRAGHAATWCSRWVRAGSATSPSCAASPAPTWRWCSTSARRTWGSSAPRTTSPRPRASWWRHCAPDGVAVLNADDPRVAAMAGRTTARVLTFGRGEQAQLRSSRRSCGPTAAPPSGCRHGDESGAGAPAAARRPHGAQRGRRRRGGAGGRHGPDDGGERAGEVRSLSRWRMELHERPDGLCVLNDAYNANPDSTAAALQALVAIGPGEGRAERSPSSARCSSWASRRRQEHRESADWRSTSGSRRWSASASRASDVVRGAREAGGEEPVLVRRQRGRGRLAAHARRAGRRRAGEGVARRAARRGREALPSRPGGAA